MNPQPHGAYAPYLRVWPRFQDGSPQVDSGPTPRREQNLTELRIFRVGEQSTGLLGHNLMGYPWEVSDESIVCAESAKELIRAF